MLARDVLLQYFSVSSLFVFTGENAFALREAKTRWIAEFIRKHGAENLLTLDPEHLQLRQLLDEVGTAPFIGGKRLVVVRGIPKWSKEEVDRLCAAIHPDCVVLFCDPSPDRRLAGVKALLAAATVREFPRLSGKSLQPWMEQQAGVLGCTLPADARDLLVGTVGEDQDTLFLEIQKLALACTGGAITAAAVRQLAVPSGEQEVWQLTGFLGRGDTAGALRYARTLYAQGEDPFSLWNILLWMLRSLVSVSCAVAEGGTQPGSIAAKASVPFPTVRALLPLAERVDREQLRACVDWAVEADTMLKTGGHRSTAEAPQELLALVDECILRCGALSAPRSTPVRSA